MVEGTHERLPHLLVTETSSTYRYTSPLSVPRERFPLPERLRSQHATLLIEQLERVRSSETEIVQEQRALGLDAGNGIYLSFESEPHFPLKFESLEYQRSGIELCAVKEVEDRVVATVFVPEGKLEYFLNKIVRYRDEDTTPRSPDKPTRPKGQDLIESISSIKMAVLRELFTDAPELFPQDHEAIWWEVWLRRSNQFDYEEFLRSHAEQLGVRIGPESINFLDRTILLVYGTSGQMTDSIRLLGGIAELRRAKDTADFYTGMDREGQTEWIDDLVERTTPPPEEVPAVCLLDTGLNEEHPLLQPVASSDDMHSYDLPNWGTDDRYGHGTLMGGLAAYGDLTIPLSHNEPVIFSHRLESVKIMPAPGYHRDKRLYGAITRESISRVEVERPERQRAFCMAVTTTDDRDRGRPSSWSATVDALTSGYEDEARRLVVLSAGNTEHDERHRYPDSNCTDEVHDPGQAWNAITVGGYTEKYLLDGQKYPGWEPVAPPGDLSPSSCTSMEWARAWPIKPEIVLEAGNMAINPDDGKADYIDDALQLLSTGHKFALGKQLVSFGDTSAASALAASLAAKILSLYPDFWPETVRALMVHFARWTPAMEKRFLPDNPQGRRQNHYRQLLRYCGYGVPNETDLFWSAKNSLTLITQDTLHPCLKEDGRIKPCDINLHELPWPTEVLEELGETEVEMRVTLSYFIEPNPGERGWSHKYRYASHGLRFSVRRSLESLSEFHKRINKKAREEDYSSDSVSDTGEWVLGEKLCTTGSIHSDTWKGTAADLASRGHIAIFPVAGWWLQRAKLECWRKEARYALVVTIRTPEVENDIYTSVLNKISAPIEI